MILGDLTATGSGSSKKQAKHRAARAMLDKLDGRVPAQDGQTPLPPVTDSANGPRTIRGLNTPASSKNKKKRRKKKSTIQSQVSFF